jgi:hypothetical protein
MWHQNKHQYSPSRSLSIGAFNTNMEGISGLIPSMCSRIFYLII